MTKLQSFYYVLAVSLATTGLSACSSGGDSGRAQSRQPKVYEVELSQEQLTPAKIDSATSGYLLALIYEFGLSAVAAALELELWRQPLTFSESVGETEQSCSGGGKIVVSVRDAGRIVESAFLSCKSGSGGTLDGRLWFIYPDEESSSAQYSLTTVFEEYAISSGGRTNQFDGTVEYTVPSPDHYRAVMNLRVLDPEDGTVYVKDFAFSHKGFSAESLENTSAYSGTLVDEDLGAVEINSEEENGTGVIALTGSDAAQARIVLRDAFLDFTYLQNLATGMTVAGTRFSYSDMWNMSHAFSGTNLAPTPIAYYNYDEAGVAPLGGLNDKGAGLAGRPVVFDLLGIFTDRNLDVLEYHASVDRIEAWSSGEIVAVDDFTLTRNGFSSFSLEIETPGYYHILMTATDPHGLTSERRHLTIEMLGDGDRDGVSDNDDEDDDNDGTPDRADHFPFDPTEVEDTDGDGIGNFADADDDGDSVPDHNDLVPLNPNCAFKEEMDGQNCYVEIMWNWTTVSDQQEVIYFYRPGRSDIARWNTRLGKFVEPLSVGTPLAESTLLHEVVFSKSHNRLYLAYDSGDITFIDLDQNGDETIFSVGEGYRKSLTMAGEFILARHQPIANDTESVRRYKTPAIVEILDGSGALKAMTTIAPIASPGIYDPTLNIFYDTFDGEDLDMTTGELVMDQVKDVPAPIVYSEDEIFTLREGGQVYDAHLRSYVGTLMSPDCSFTSPSKVAWLTSGFHCLASYGYPLFESRVLLINIDGGVTAQATLKGDYHSLFSHQGELTAISFSRFPDIVFIEEVTLNETPSVAD